MLHTVLYVGGALIGVPSFILSEHSPRFKDSRTMFTLIGIGAAVCFYGAWVHLGGR